MNVLWEGPIYDPSGYGKCSRDYVKYLSYENDVNILPVVTNYFTSVPAYIDKQFFKDLINRFDKDRIGKYVYVEHKTPNVLNNVKDADLSVGYTVWETPESPKEFRSFLDTKDVILTPSQFSADSLRCSGTRTSIQVIPHIIDFSKFNPNIEVNKPDKLTFLYNGEFTTRKGIDILLEAYCKAFTSKDDVVLFLKTYLLDRNVSNNNYIMNYIREFKKKFTDAPDIRVMDGIISDDDLPKLYASCDVFVTATRGEGFGLPIAEALACGKPVIVPSAGGFDEFCKGNHAYRVRGKFVDIDSSKLEPSRKLYSNQRWFECDVDGFVEAFRYTYDMGRNEINKLKSNAYNAVYEHCNGKKIIKDMLEIFS